MAGSNSKKRPVPHPPSSMIFASICPKCSWISGENKKDNILSTWMSHSVFKVLMCEAAFHTQQFSSSSSKRQPLFMAGLMRTCLNRESRNCPPPSALISANLGFLGHVGSKGTFYGYFKQSFKSAVWDLIGMWELQFSKHGWDGRELKIMIGHVMCMRVALNAAFLLRSVAPTKCSNLLGRVCKKSILPHSFSA